MDKVARRGFSDREKEKILKKTNFRCGHCGKSITVENMTIEHIYPISKGGKHDEYNIIGLCRKCNYNKSNSIYEVKDYFKYILPEFLPKYIMYNTEIVEENRGDNRFLEFDTKVYGLLPFKQKKLLYNMMKRKAKKSQIVRTANQMMVKLKLELASETDVDDILKLINYLDDKNIKNDLSLYRDNEYMVRNTIRYGNVYVLRCGKELHGAFMFMRAKTLEYEMDLDFVQLNNIETNTILKKKYVMTFGYVDRFAYDVFEDIMEDMLLNFVKIEAIPIYFNILGGVYVDKQNIVQLPYKINNVEGKLEFFNIKGLKESLKHNFQSSLVYEDYPDEEIEEIIDVLIARLEDIDMSEEERAKRRDRQERYKEKLSEAIIEAHDNLR